MENGRTFEDVIFGAILGVWSTKVQGLWDANASWSKPFSFLLMAALLALVLKLTWEIPNAVLRLLGVGWMVLWIGGVAFGGYWGGVFSHKEAIVFGLVFAFWFAVALAADGILRLYRRA